jgi:glycosyltransferase involved in cell wall biosynthesis
MFDHLSVWERKNPDGVIRAFRAAFPSERDVRLVIKTMNADPHSPSGRLEEAVGGDPRIDVRDGYLDPDDVARLLVATDCYVSLHRAEGFGLTLAEAMAYAKPVIGTAWSGNLDFMTEENSYLVDAAVVRLESDYHPYPRGSHWAEPDLDHAAYQMRAVRADRAEADRRAWRGRAHVRAAFSAQRVAYLVRQRLDTIRRTVGARSA